MSAKPIAVVQGADSATIQRLLAEVLDASWRPARIAGVIEAAEDYKDDTIDGVNACGPGTLRNIGDGQAYPLFQDLGPHSTACALDAGGVTDACGAVCRDIAAGCDLVILSKFGKLEAETRSGLLGAFTAAMEAGVPILTAVSPRNQARWDEFAAPLYHVLRPSLSEVEAWLTKHGNSAAPAS